MSANKKKSVIPSKEDLIGKLMDVVNGYDGTETTPVRPTDCIRAVEVLCKVLGYNSADKAEIEVTQLQFELG